MLTITETLCWVILGMIAGIIVLAIPVIDNYVKNQEAERMLNKNEIF